MADTGGPGPGAWSGLAGAITAALGGLALVIRAWMDRPPRKGCSQEELDAALDRYEQRRSASEAKARKRAGKRTPPRKDTP